jgi:hypothetical protein
VTAALEHEEFGRQGGTVHVNGRVGPAVDALRSSARLLATAEHLLGPGAELGGVGLRAPLPGFGAQALHTDFAGPPPADGPAVAVAIVALVDVTADGGATRVEPGSHRRHRTAPGATVDRRYPGERFVALTAGSAVLLDGRLRHPQPQRPPPRRAEGHLHPARRPDAVTVTGAVAARRAALRGRACASSARPSPPPRRPRAGRAA